MSIDEVVMGLEQVFLWTGDVVHFVDRTITMLPEEVEERRPALCGLRPYWPGIWFHPEDHERAASLPTCIRCSTIAGAGNGDGKS